MTLRTTQLASEVVSVLGGDVGTAEVVDDLFAVNHGAVTLRTTLYI